MSMIESPEEFRLRSSDHWEAAAMYAQGWPIVGTEVEDNRVVLVFPDGGERLRQAVQAHRSGSLQVSTLAMRSAFYHVRSLIDVELRHAQYR
jgi:hypothetical protein